MSRRFRYYALPPGAVEEQTPAMVFRSETGQDYETYESVQDGQWVQDNAAYEYVHGSGEARECDAAEAHQLIAELVDAETADRLVPQRPD